MADSKISALADGTSPQSTDQFVVDRGGASNVRLSWSELLALMPGYEIGYDQITSNVTVATATSPGTTVITCAAHTFDGAPVMATFFSPDMAPGAADFITVVLTEGGSQVGQFGAVSVGSGTGTEAGVTLQYRFTPSVGSHSYVVTGLRGSSNGTIHAGAGAGVAYVPAFIRFTKV